MRCAIFYVLTPIRDLPPLLDYWPVIDLHAGITARVRMEIVEAQDLGAALDMAQPRDGEAVMNTHEVA